MVSLCPCTLHRFNTTTYMSQPHLIFNQKSWGVEDIKDFCHRLGLSFPHGDSESNTTFPRTCEHARQTLLHDEFSLARADVRSLDPEVILQRGQSRGSKRQWDVRIRNIPYLVRERRIGRFAGRCMHEIEAEFSIGRNAGP